MKKPIIILFTLLFIFSCKAKDFLCNFPKGYTPDEIGEKLTLRFIESPHASKNMINYPEVCTWYGALKFAEETKNEKLKIQLQERFDLLLDEEQHLLPITGFFKYVNGHYVDFTMFGCLPLELYNLTKDKKYLNLGLFYADYQWKLPDFADEQQTIYHKQGLSWQTRYWIDDMYMITILQSKAFQATGNRKYIDRAAAQMVSYLDTLQRSNGLFYHSVDAPFYWARGNGWIAVGMTEMLQYMPVNHPDRPRIMKSYLKMMKSLKQYQRKDGTWGQLIDKPDIWIETSGSAMFAYAFITGVRQGWLNATEYGKPTRKAWIALVNYLNTDGDLTEICAGTGKNPNEKFYYDRPRKIGDFHGQAPMLWCAAAFLETKNKKQ